MDGYITQLLFRKTLALYFPRNGAKFSADGGSLRTGVEKGLLHNSV